FRLLTLCRVQYIRRLPGKLRRQVRLLVQHSGEPCRGYLLSLVFLEPARNDASVGLIIDGDFSVHWNSEDVGKLLFLSHVLTISLDICQFLFTGEHFWAVEHFFVDSGE